MKPSLKSASMALAFVVGLASLLTATPAQASTTIQVTDVDCQTGTLIGTPITAAPGDVLEFILSSTGTAVCDTGYVAQSLVDSSTSIDVNSNTGVPPVSTSGADWTFSTAGRFTTLQVTLGSTLGTSTIQLWTGSTYSTTWTVTIATGGGGDGASASSRTPPPWLQSHGRTQHEKCRTGWHPSWAEWAVDKTGGWVCNRTVYWSGSTWVQNPNAVWGTTDLSQNASWDGS